MASFIDIVLFGFLTSVNPCKVGLYCSCFRRTWWIATSSLRQIAIIAFLCPRRFLSLRYLFRNSGCFSDLTTALAIWTRNGLRYLPPLEIRVENFFPALSLFAGTYPAHEQSLPADSKTDISAPISEITRRADSSSLNPGTV